MYLHLFLLQTQANQPVPMLKVMWAVSVTLASSTAWCPCFSPNTIGIPRYLSPVVLHPVSHWNLIFFSTGGDQSWEERQPGSQRRLWGMEQSFDPAYQRGHPALWAIQMLRGWDRTMTRARHLFVTSPLQVFTSKSCSAGNNNSFTERTVL